MTWTTIPDSDIDPGSPLTAALFGSLRDNVEAAMSGDTGAPRLGITALASPAVGDLIKLERTGIVQTSGGPLNIMIFTLLQSGNIRITFDQRIQSGGTCRARVLINASVVYDISTTSSSFVARTTDQAIAAGDVFSVTVEQTSPLGERLAQIQDLRIRTSGAYLLPFLASNISVINP